MLYTASVVWLLVLLWLSKNNVNKNNKKSMLCRFINQLMHPAYYKYDPEHDNE